MAPNDIARSFKILRKCQNKLDCLIFEMLFIKELKPSLNKQCDSIRAKLFVFIFYSHLKMASERSKRRDLLAFIFITKSWYK